MELSILTPVKKLVSVQCQEALIPGIKGEMGLLSEHAELVSLLSTGVVSFKTAEGEQKFAVRGGFVKVAKNKITILADEAYGSKNLSKEELRKEKESLEKKLISPDVGIEEREKLFDQRDFLNAKLSVF